VTLPPNVTMEIYADKWQLFDNFAVLAFEVENKSPAAVAIDDVRLATKTDEHGDTARIPGDGAARCTLSILDLAALDADELRLVLVTDRGEAQLSW